MTRVVLASAAYFWTTLAAVHAIGSLVFLFVIPGAAIYTFLIATSILQALLLPLLVLTWASGYSDSQVLATVKRTVLSNPYVGPTLVAPPSSRNPEPIETNNANSNANADADADESTPLLSPPSSSSSSASASHRTPRSPTKKQRSRQEAGHSDADSNGTSTPGSKRTLRTVAESSSAKGKRKSVVSPTQGSPSTSEPTARRGKSRARNGSSSSSTATTAGNHNENDNLLATDSSRPNVFDNTTLGGESRGSWPRRLKAFLHLRPFRSSVIISLTMVNIVMMLVCTDYVFRPYLLNRQTGLIFSKVGGVTAYDARISGRFPHHSYVALCYSQRQPVRSMVSGHVRSADEKDVECVDVQVLPTNDHVVTVHLKELEPNTRYYYRWFTAAMVKSSKWRNFKDDLSQLQFSFLNFNFNQRAGKEKIAYHKGDPIMLTTSTTYGRKLTAAERDNETDEYGTDSFREYDSELNDPKYLTFKTAPIGPGEYTFGYSSCVMPNFPYGTQGVRGFQEMANQNIDFSLFLGDLIYSDNPWLYSTSIEAYRWHYRVLYSQPEFLSVFKNLSMSTIYDDHEILNDWRWEDEEPFSTALKAYNEYAGDANPDSHIDRTPDHRKKEGASSKYKTKPRSIRSSQYTFNYGDMGFFVMDTRRFRNLTAHHMLGKEQLTELYDWLQADESLVKFIVSSVPFTQNWRIGTDDTWGGYLTERQDVLNFIAKKQIRNVYILSGDRHEVGVTQLPHGIIEFSTSPLQAFYSPIDTYKETGEDKRIFTWRPGNIKWATITVDTKNNKNPRLTYKLFVSDIQSEPIKELTYALDIE